MAAVDQIARRGRESTCANCAHAGGWHEQTPNKLPKVGGPCRFPGCECGCAGSRVAVARGVAGGYQPGRRPQS